MAQESTITLKPGDSLEEFTKKHVYRYPDFVSSRVIYSDGANSRGKLNFNQLSGKMMFIDPKGDTLELINDGTIKQVILDNSIYYRDNGYYEIIKDDLQIRFAMKKPFRLANKRKVGAMGIASSTLGMDSYDSSLDLHSLIRFTPNVEHVFSTAPYYYFGDAKGKFLPATQKNLLKIAPHKKDTITAYLKDNPVNFNKMEEVLKVLAHIRRN